ncbi:hypothetical protein FRB98_007804 [Tulasnella sp. 332]|nr:hypothetical protein FRB98_007804 [Tulasnella sp. 332]
MLRLVKLSSRSFLFVGGTAGVVAAANYAAGPLLADEGLSTHNAKPAATTGDIAPRKARPIIHRTFSIYPKSPPEIHIMQTESELANHIGVAREYATDRYVEGRDTIQGWVNGWISVEGRVEQRVKEIIPKDEPMTPGLLYVGVATLTGSILGRNRIAPVRFLLPPTALVISLAYFLPKTFANVSTYTSSLERTYIPTFQDNRQQIQKSISDSLFSSSKALSNTRDRLSANIDWARKEVESSTGLKIGGHGVGTTSPNLQPTAAPIGEQISGSISRIQDEVKKLGVKAGDAVEGVAEDVKIKTLGTETAAAGTKKEEDYPKRLV